MSALALHRVVVAEYLKAYRGRKVKYFPNPGNAGDSLISLGALQMFERLGIPFEVIDAGARVEGETVVLGGGGNLVPLYSNTREALLRFRREAKRMILLPHTIRGNEDLLAALGEESVIFCRDPASYQHVLAASACREVYLAHDMAFHVDCERILEDPRRAEFGETFRGRMASQGVDLGSERLRKEAFYVRRDVESRRLGLRSDVDVSQLFDFGVTPGRAELGSWCLLEAIRRVEAVTTDRLHVGIGAALLGTPCRLHDNSYGKNAQVFHHSIRSAAPHVSFVP